MALRSRRFLGLAVEQGSILAAEVHVAGDRRELKRAAAFTFPEDVSLEDPIGLGKALALFLREHRFSARHAVLGVPARWLLVKEKTFPPSSGEAFAKMMRIEAEQAFSGGPSDLAIDYADGHSSEAGRPVLLVAARRLQINQLADTARAAGVRAVAITPSVMALAARQSEPDTTVALYLRPGCVEMALQTEGRLRAVRHLPVGQYGGVEPGAWAGDIARRVRQAVSLRPAEGTSAPHEAVVWDGVGLGPDALEALGEGLSLRTTAEADLSALGIVSDEQAASRFAAAAALASAGAQPGALAVDLMHSKLAVPGKRAVGRKAVWAAVVSAAAAAMAVGLIVHWRHEERAVAALRQQLTAMEPDVEAARAVVENVSVARQWYDRRPPFLDCLRQLTLAFPQQGSIWATSLAIRQDMRAVVSGKASDQTPVLDVLDRLKKNTMFDDLKLLHMRYTSGAQRDISFAISFNFVDTE